MTDTAVLMSDAEYLVKKVPKTKLPPFRMIGENVFNVKDEKAFNLLDEMATFCSAEQWFFQLLRENMDYETGVSHVVNKELTKSEVNKRTLAMRLLRERGLVKRMRREYYLINPNALVNKNGYKSSNEMWEALPK